MDHCTSNLYQGSTAWQTRDDANKQPALFIGIPISATSGARFLQIPLSLLHSKMDCTQQQPGTLWEDKPMNLSSEPAVMPTTTGQTSTQITQPEFVFANLVLVCVQVERRKGELAGEYISQC